MDSAALFSIGGGLLLLFWSFWLPREMARVRTSASTEARSAAITRTMEGGLMRFCLMAAKVLGTILVVFGIVGGITGWL